MGAEVPLCGRPDRAEGRRVARVAPRVHLAGARALTVAQALCYSCGVNEHGKPSGTKTIDVTADALLTECEQAIGYQFDDRELLRSALTHASRADHRLASNERLEFLGDAILGTIICEYLFHSYPDYLEGELTKIKSAVVSRRTCARVSRKLDMGRFLLLGKGVITGSTLPPSLMADVFESLLGAIYLDGGAEAARRFVLVHLDEEISRVAGDESGDNYKSLLQQLAQRDFAATPTYVLRDEKGPDHSKCFKISAVVDGRHFAPAWGRNKKEAEQKAAQNALKELNGEPPPFTDG